MIQAPCTLADQHIPRSEILQQVENIGARAAFEKDGCTEYYRDGGQWFVSKRVDQGAILSLAQRLK